MSSERHSCLLLLADEGGEKKLKMGGTAKREGKSSRAKRSNILAPPLELTLFLI